MLDLFIENGCRKDIKRAGKRGKVMARLRAIVDRLQKAQPLERRCRVHRLAGDWSPYWECHIEPDRLLIYHVTDTHLFLVRTATHADIFG